MKRIARSEKKNRRPGVPWLFLALLMVMVSVVIGSIAIPRSLAAQVTMEVYQQEGNKIFGQSTSLDIFDNPKLGGKKLVAPFTMGSYTFGVCNTAASNLLPYSLDVLADNPEDIPIVVSLQKNGVYVFGGANEADMLPFSSMHFPEINLGGKKTDLYTVRWMWKTDTDEKDTAIGNIGTQLYKMTITATGTIDETSPISGDNTNRPLWIALTVVGLLLFILLLFKRRKPEEEDVQAVS